MDEIIFYYARIKGEYVFPCPINDDQKVKLQLCRRCIMNRKEISGKWVRCAAD